MRANPDAETKPQGSFGIPENIRKAQEKFESQKKPIKPDVSEPAVVEAKEQSKEDAVEEVMQAQRKEAYASIVRMEERLGISVTKSDIIDFVRKGRIEKKDVQVIPGVLSVGFRTLTGDEIQDVQKRIFEFENSTSTTKTAVDNEAAFWNLAYGLSSYQGRDMTAVADKQKAKELLTKVGAHIIDKMNAAFVDFNYIVRFKINDPEFIKKS